MAPILESDVAEERFQREEWRNFELWEEVERRTHRRRRIWIAATAVVFTALSAVPVFVDQRPKWISQHAARNLALEINHIKQDAAVDHQAYRIQFESDGSTRFAVFRSVRCSDREADLVREGSLIGSTHVDLVHVLTPAEGEGIDVPGLTRTLCYDPLVGASDQEEFVAGFGFVPVGDLDDNRQDRLQVLVVKGSSAEISFN